MPWIFFTCSNKNPPLGFFSSKLKVADKDLRARSLQPSLGLGCRVKKKRDVPQHLGYVNWVGDVSI